ncbi:MAG: ATP-dependent DNA helicase, partial [Planctomycetota bacterium]
MRAAKDCLGPGSPIATTLEGFQPRPQQLAMAEAVEEAIAEGHHLAVEAGTGVGKSFAYLAPALLHLAEGGGPVMVATRTIALQEQLVRKDIPLLLDVLGLDRLKVALAKGRGNYVCLRRTEMACTEGSSLFENAAALSELDRVRAWAHESRDGSLADLAFRPRADVWDACRAESGNCLHKRCRFYASCAYQQSKRELYGADLLVANHALVFADLALREAGVRYLPDYETLVLDEAHEIEDGVADYFGTYVSPLGIARQLGRFMGVRRHTGLFGRVEVGPDLYEAVEEVRAAVKTLFSDVARYRGDHAERRIREARVFANPLSAPLSRLVRGLRKRHGSIQDPELALEWKSRTDRLEEVGDAVDLVHGTLDEGLVYWTEGVGVRKHSILRAAPKEVGPILRRALFSKVRSVICTSATLRVAGSIEHFKRRVGLEAPSESALGSPFDFARQCVLRLYPGMPDPRLPSYDEAVVERLRELVRETGGGAFLLFTSYRALLAAHDALRPELEEAGLHVMRQGGDLRTSDIVGAFKEREDCVLFGTDTFWQGIDVRGRNLRLVVITRLPFAVPSHPLQEARTERIEEEGGDPFGEFSLPQAVLKLRQGF